MNKVGEGGKNGIINKQGVPSIWNSRVRVTPDIISL